MRSQDTSLRALGTSEEASAERKAASGPCRPLEADIPVVRVHFFPPLAETVVAAFSNYHLDAGGVLIGDYGAHRCTVLPDVHQRRVGHLVSRQHFHLTGEQPVLE